MKVSQEVVIRLARLARLELAEDKLELFAKQIGDTLTYVDKLSELDTVDILPMYRPHVTSTFKRSDVVCNEHTLEQVLSNAPNSDGVFFIVPRIIPAMH